MQVDNLCNSKKINIYDKILDKQEIEKAIAASKSMLESHGYTQFYAFPSSDLDNSSESQKSNNQI